MSDTGPAAHDLPPENGRLSGVSGGNPEMSIPGPAGTPFAHRLLPDLAKETIRTNMSG